MEANESERKSGEQSLGASIRRHSEEIMERWMAAVIRDIGSRGLSPTEFRDAIGDYLEAISASLSGEAVGPLNERSGAVWAKIAREHGFLRVQQGFNIQELVHEFIVLRRVLQEVATEGGLVNHVQQTQRLVELIEGAIANSVQSYVESRDKEARRREAEHVGFLTHELRSPLTTALITTQQLRHLSGSTREHSHLTEVLERSLLRLKVLVDDVLLTERLESGAVAAKPVEIMCGDLLQEPLSNARRAGESRGVAVNTQEIPEVLLHVDPKLARSAVQNVLDNAVKYSELGPVEVRFDAEPGQVVVHVRDHCHGLTAEELRTIFLPFKRGRTRHEGTGLGLAIARRALEAQGGTIQAESSGDVGCHFWFTLPRATH